MNEVEQKIIASLQSFADRLEAIETKLCEAAQPDPELLTIKQAAKKYGVSPHTLYRRPELQVRIGRAIRICPVRMQRYLEYTNR